MAGKATARNSADDLLVLTHDGDRYLDPHVRQVLGMLISDQHRWVLPVVPPASVYRFVSPDQPPVKDRAAFIYRDDPPDIERDAWVVNRVGVATAKMAYRGHWNPWVAFTERAGALRYVILVLVVIGVIVSGYYSGQRNLERDIREMELKAAQAATERDRAALAGEGEPSPRPTPPPPELPDEQPPDTSQASPQYPAEGADATASKPDSSPTATRPRAPPA